MRRIVLVEHAQQRVELAPGVAEGLAGVGHALTVLPTTSPGVWSLATTSHVGTIVTDDVEVHIRPKVPVDNVLHLLWTGWLGKPPGQRLASTGASELAPAAIDLFARTMTDLLRRGVPRSYVEMTEDLDTVRGRIDLVSQFRRPGLVLPVRCTFQDHTADTLLARHLKAAVRAALRFPRTWGTTRRALRHALVGLSEVTDRPPSLAAADDIAFDRLNRSAEPASRLADLVRRGVGPGSEGTQKSARAFVLDMNTVFERWLEVGLRRALGGRLDVEAQRRTHLDREGRVPLIPDLVLRWQDGADVYVVDAKYKRSDSGVGRSDDYQQLLAYCDRLDLPEGMLVHAGAGAAQNEATTLHAVGSGTRLCARSLRLDGSPTDLEQRLREFADELVRRCGAVAASDGEAVPV